MKLESMPNLVIINTLSEDGCALHVMTVEGEFATPIGAAIVVFNMKEFVKKLERVKENERMPV